MVFGTRQLFSAIRAIYDLRRLADLRIPGSADSGTVILDLATTNPSEIILLFFIYAMLRH